MVAHPEIRLEDQVDDSVRAESFAFLWRRISVCHASSEALVQLTGSFLQALVRESSIGDGSTDRGRC